MKIYFLIPTAFSNYLTGSIISGSTMEIFFYEETKFQRLRTNSFCVADFQRELILGDFITFSHFFAVLHSRKLQLLLQFSRYWSAVCNVMLTIELSTKCLKWNIQFFAKNFSKGPEVQKKFNLKIKSRVCDRLL